MRKSWLFLLAAILIVGGLWWRANAPQAAATHETPAVAASGAPRAPEPLLHTEAPAAKNAADRTLPAFLPPEAHRTLRLIADGGPFPYRQDGSVFGNREGRLPQKPRGYYREYTVDTPGLKHRGARRIVTGGTPPGEYWYTDDHYDSFRRFETAP